MYVSLYVFLEINSFKEFNLEFDYINNLNFIEPANICGIKFPPKKRSFHKVRERYPDSDIYFCQILKIV